MGQKRSRVSNMGGISYAPNHQELGRERSLNQQKHEKRKEKRGLSHR